MNDQPVIVIGDVLGNVIVQSKNNSEWGYIRVIQKFIKPNSKGFLNTKTRSALIRGKYEELKQLGLKSGDCLEGRIIIKEMFNPPGAVDKNLKIAGKTGVVCSVDGQPIYRLTIYTEDPDEEDEFIKHDNSDEIREAALAQQTLDELLSDEVDL